MRGAGVYNRICQAFSGAHLPAIRRPLRGPAAPLHRHPAGASHATAVGAASRRCCFLAAATRRSRSAGTGFRLACPMRCLAGRPPLPAQARLHQCGFTMPTPACPTAGDRVFVACGPGWSGWRRKCALAPGTRVLISPAISSPRSSACARSSGSSRALSTSSSTPCGQEPFPKTQPGRHRQRRPKLASGDPRGQAHSSSCTRWSAAPAVRKAAASAICRPISPSTR